MQAVEMKVMKLFRTSGDYYTCTLLNYKPNEGIRQEFNVISSETL
jgi:hypothetical protein